MKNSFSYFDLKNDTITKSPKTSIETHLTVLFIWKNQVYIKKVISNGKISLKGVLRQFDLSNGVLDFNIEKPIILD